MTAAAHAHDVPIFAQLNHNGGQASSMFSRLPVWAPSPVPDPMFREVPKAVERHEIAEIVAGYATVAGHCVLDRLEGGAQPVTQVFEPALGGRLQRLVWRRSNGLRHRCSLGGLSLAQR